MSLADEIRRHALQHYVVPARTAGNNTFTLRAGDVSRNMSLHNRVPAICGALSSQKFLDMGSLELIERNGPWQSTTTTFRYSVVSVSKHQGGQNYKGSIVKPGKKSRPVLSSAAPLMPSNLKHSHAKDMPDLQSDGDSEDIVVIQCAASKQTYAGNLKTENGQPVMFVAHPAKAPKQAPFVFSRPDNPAKSSLSYRDVVAEYNRNPTDNPLQLLPAWQLYKNSIYGQLVRKYGISNVYILSAGWGLIASDFLIPDYDITFSKSADAYKQRRSRDRYSDFSMLPIDTSSRIIFLGGKDYVQLFCDLTINVKTERIVFYNSAIPPNAPNCRLLPFLTTTRRNWHYECARKLIEQVG